MPRVNCEAAAAWPQQLTWPPRGLQEQKATIKAAVATATEAWGERQLAPLEAEDRLSVACEKAPTDDPVLSELRAAFKMLEGVYEPECAKQKDEITSLGGLHVIGTERHEARRIDNQLRGRCGRQGDPGSTRFFLSLEDNIFRIFGGDKIQGMMNVRPRPAPPRLRCDKLATSLLAATSCSCVLYHLFCPR